MILPRSVILHAVLALIASGIIMAVQMQGTRPDLRASDSFAYLSVAHDLSTTGIFTDGNYKSHAAVTGEKGQGMFFAPLYPAIVSWAFQNSPPLKAAYACHVDAKTQAATDACPDDFGWMTPIHAVMATLAAFLVWPLALIVTNRKSVAWGALGLALLAEAYAHYTAQMMTENLVFPLFTLSTLLIVLAYKKKKALLWIAAGVALGLLALTRPSFGYVFYAFIPLAALLAAGVSWRSVLIWPVALVVGYAITAGPWIARNMTLFNEPVISKGYAPFILSQRIAYNDMGWNEWRASFVYGLPDFGDSLASSLFPPQHYERFRYDNPAGFYVRGNEIVRDQTRKDAGGADKQLSYLIKHDIIGNAYKHVMVTVSLAWQGMWVSKYWGLIAIPVFIGVALYAVAVPWPAFLLAAFPAWFMLGFHAFTSVNVVRYNLILIPALSIAVAYALSSLWNTAYQKYKQCR